MGYTQTEIETIKKLDEQNPKPIRVTIGVGTMMHALLSNIARSEAVHPNTVVRAMIKAALVEWLKHSTSYPEFNDEVRRWLTDEQL